MKLLAGFVSNKTLKTQYFAALLEALKGVRLGPLPSLALFHWLILPAAVSVTVAHVCVPNVACVPLHIFQ